MYLFIVFVYESVYERDAPENNQQKKAKDCIQHSSKMRGMFSLHLQYRIHQ